MRFDRKQFFDGYRDHFGKIGIVQVRGLSELLDFIEADKYVRRLTWAAYILATAKHETADTFHPIHEYGSKAYFVKRYGGQTKKGQELGNDTPDEGYYYAGGGYPQTTGESNYEKAEIALRNEYPEVVADFENRTGKTFDLTVGDQPDDTSDPANMLDPAIAYATMSFGMRTGMFTGKKLSDYLSDEETDYLHARKIINDLDKAGPIAAYAKAFEEILRSSKTSAIPAAIPDKQGKKPPSTLPVTIESPSPTGATSSSSEITKKTEAETKDGTESVAVSTTVGQNVVIEKRVEEGWLSAKWKQVTGLFTAGGVLDGVTDKAKEAQSLGLSPEFWDRLFYVAAACGIVWLAVDWWKHHSKIVEAREMDKVLVAANSTPNNFVQFAPTEYLQEYRNRGYKVITR